MRDLEWLLILLCVLAVFKVARANDVLYSTSIKSYVSPTSTQYDASKGNMVQYRPGNVIIGGMMRVHKRGAGDKCSIIRDDGIQAVETFNMILDMVNADKNLLPGVKLGSIMIDTCDIDTHALNGAVTTFLPIFFGSRRSSSGNPVMFGGVIGASSSAVSIQTANLLSIFKIPQISPWSTHPDLSNKNRFTYFFRTVPNDAIQADAMVELIAERNWNYISVVYEDDLYGIRGFREIDKAAKAKGICVALSRAIHRNPTQNDYQTIVNDLIKVKESKAVILFMKINDAEGIIKAADLNPESRGVFLFIGSDGWAGQIPTNPSTFAYSTSLNRSLTFQPKRNVILELLPYMSNLTLGQHFSNETLNPRNPWFPEYVSYKLNCKLNGSISNSSARPCTSDDHLDSQSYTTLAKMQSVADAVLALAHSLDRYLQEACNGSAGLCDHVRKNGGKSQLAQNIFPYLQNVSFNGINGSPVRFDKNQDGAAIYDIASFSSSEQWKNVGLYKNREITWYNEYNSSINVESICSQPCQQGEAKKTESSVCCWQCQSCHIEQYVANGTECRYCVSGFRPNDNRDGCTPLPINELGFHEPFAIISLAVAFFGILLTIAVGLIYFKHRETAIVKASGKELCVFVLLGAFLSFLNTFVLCWPSNDASCAIARFLLCFGPTITYAGLLTKTIRVVIIFRAKSFLSPQVKAFLRPKMQILTVFAFTLLQAFAIVVWFVVRKTPAEVIYPAPRVVFRACKDLADLSVLVGIAYPGILMLGCTVLATVNRNVPTGFNETQYIGFTMYASCLIWLAFLPIYITNSQNIGIRIASIAISLSLSAITVLICLFGFRCYTILFHPESNTSTTVMSVGPPSSSLQVSSPSGDKHKQISTSQTGNSFVVEKTVSSGVNTTVPDNAKL